jgi:hypothetical protein
MNKKRSPKEIIEEEAAKDPKKEYAFVKFRGKELFPLKTKPYRSGLDIDDDYIRSLGSYKEKRNILHTHPYDPESPRIPKGRTKPNKKLDTPPIPSSTDLKDFLLDSEATSQYIAQYNIRSRKVEGYFVIRKTSKTPKSPNEHLESMRDAVSRFKPNEVKGVYYHLISLMSSNNISKKIVKHNEESMSAFFNDSPEEAIHALDNLSKKFHLKYRFIPAEGYEVSKYRTHLVKKARGLESKVAGIISIIGLAGYLLFFSTNITGNVISSLTVRTTSTLGLIFLTIGLIAGLFWVKVRNKLKSN